LTSKRTTTNLQYLPLSELCRRSVLLDEVSPSATSEPACDLENKQ